MQTKHSTGLPRNAGGLPLFVWADTHSAVVELLEKLPFTAGRIARRFGLSPRLACICAEHAGFQSANLYV
jgi:hypothetical protein